MSTSFNLPLSYGYNSSSTALQATPGMRLSLNLLEPSDLLWRVRSVYKVPLQVGNASSSQKHYRPAPLNDLHACCLIASAAPFCLKLRSHDGKVDLSTPNIRHYRERELERVYQLWHMPDTLLMAEPSASRIGIQYGTPNKKLWTKKSRLIFFTLMKFDVGNGAKMLQLDEERRKREHVNFKKR